MEAEAAEFYTLWARYIESFKGMYEIWSDDYPEVVREAYGIMIAFGERIGNPSNEKKTLHEALFSKIPREKVKWAIRIYERWNRMDEKRAAVKQKEQKRREENNGRVKERTLTEKQDRKIYENFESHWILDAVDALDEIRYILGDKYDEDGCPRPPEIRTQLLALHGKAMNLVNSGPNKTDHGVFDMAWEIEGMLSDAREQLEKIQKIIHALTDLTPDADLLLDDDDDEDQDSQSTNESLP